MNQMEAMKTVLCLLHKTAVDEVTLVIEQGGFSKKFEVHATLSNGKTIQSEVYQTTLDLAKSGQLYSYAQEEYDKKKRKDYGIAL